MTGRSPTQAGPVRVVGTVAAGLACTSLPIFLTGALSSRIGVDIGIGTAGIGVAVAAFFLGGALASVPGGRIADRIGSSAALRIGFAISTVCSVAIAAVVDRGWLLILTLLVGGTAVALVDTSGARALAAAVERTRQGLAFGVKEASIPVAALLAGVTLPLLGNHIGWRPAFVAAAAIATVAGLSVPPRMDTPRRAVPSAAATSVAITDPADPDASNGPPDGAPTEERPTSRATSTTSTPGAAPNGVLRPLLALAVAAGLGGGTAASVATFLVPSSEAAGLTAGAAGMLLAIASAASVLSRLGTGVLADRLLGSELRLVGGLLAVGTLGIAGLASNWLPAIVPSAILALGGGWGWTGLLFLAAVRIDPERPARAAGIVLAGLAVGGTLGPISVGSLADRAGFTTAWTLGATAMAVACVVTIAAERSRRRR